MATVLNAFPSSVPAIAVKTRAVLLGTAGNLQTKLAMAGEYGLVIASDPKGRVIYESQILPLEALPGLIEIPVLQVRRDFRVTFDYYNFPSRFVDYSHSRQNLPFDFQKKKRRGKSPQISIRIITPISDERRDTLRTARIRANRSYRPKLRRPWTPLSKRGNGIQQFQSVSKWNYTNGSGTTGTDTYLAFQKTASSVSTPNYTVKKKRGQLPQNPYSMSMEVTADGGYGIDAWNSNGLGSYSTRGGSYLTQLGGSFGNPPGTFTPSNNVKNRAIRKLQERVGPMNNLAQDLLQMRQTSDMIGNTARRIAASLMQAKKGNLTGAASTLFGSKPPRFKKGKEPSHKKNLADNWLALQYGWKPLLQDVDGAMDSLARLNLQSTMVYTQRSSAHVEDSRVNVLHVGGPATPVCGSQIQITTVDYRYGIRYQIDNHLKTFLSQTGFTNSLNLAWEVLPYSFVVDWFIPIGPYLESFSAWDGLQFLDGWSSTLTKSSTFWNVGYTGPLNPLTPGDVQMIGMYGSCRRDTTTYARTKLTAFPAQVIPSFKNPVSVEHSLNALALLTSVFSHK